METVKHRENTFKVDLSVFPKRPSFEEIHKFVRETLGLKQEQLVRLQMNHAQNCAHVKCVDLQTAINVVDAHNERHEIEVGGKKIKVRLVMEDGGLEIKVHDLSENVSNEDICEFLKTYGEIISIKEVMWGEKFAFSGVSSGIRIVKMILRKHIRSFVIIKGEQTLITYRNQPQTCRHCTNLAHPGSTCVQNKKLLGQKADLEHRLRAARKKQPGHQTYADMVSNNSTANSLMPHFAQIGSLNETVQATQQDESVSPENAPGSPTAASTIQTESMEVSGDGKLENAPNDFVDHSALCSTTETSTSLPEAQTNITQCNVLLNSKEVNCFKIPTVTNNACTTMAISDNESNESSTDNEFKVKQAKRMRGRPKKAKLDDKRCISPPQLDKK